MTVRCWHEDPTQRPAIAEVVGLLRKMLASSLSMEADLSDFFEVCKAQGRGNREEKAQQFADELDEVCHTEMHNVNSSHHESRHLTTQAFVGKNGSNICRICKSCVALLTSFRPLFRFHRNPSNKRSLPLIRVVSRVCSRRHSTGALL